MQYSESVEVFGILIANFFPMFVKKVLNFCNLTFIKKINFIEKDFSWNV